MHISNWIRLPLLIVVMVLLSRSIGVNAALSDYPLAQTPLFLGEKSPPLMMMVMSRDEQLFNKAYSDYTDLDGDGTLETPYQGDRSAEVMYVIDGFIVSANVKVNSVQTYDLNFRNSDHQPVAMEFTLQ